MDRIPDPKPERRQLVAAWSVHALTASGVVWGFLALGATLAGRPVDAFLWLGLAFVVDGVDGTLARWCRVKELTPRFDGATLDVVVDYFTYVLVPAVMLFKPGLLPAGWETPGAIFVLLVSLYTFANIDMKTHDHYFRGFPAVWNIVVLYLMILRTPSSLNLAVIILCGLLTFVPWKYVHPLRVTRLRPVTLVCAVAWLMASLYLVLQIDKPEHSMLSAPLVFWVWIATSIYFAAISSMRSIEPD